MSRILAVSDIHLGTGESNREDFFRFLDACDAGGIDHLVLLGDIVDFWRRNNAKIINDTKNAEILDKIARLNAGQVHYVVGNHDYALLHYFERYGDNFPFSVTKHLRLEDGGNSFYFIHGYELEVHETLEPATVDQYEQFCGNMCYAEDVIGGFAGTLWDLKEGCEEIIEKTTKFLRTPPNERGKIENLYNLAISKGAYILLGMKPDEYLIYGHTHRPYISEQHRRANTGAWVQDETLSPASINTYVSITGGRMALRKFGRDPFP